MNLLTGLIFLLVGFVVLMIFLIVVGFAIAGVMKMKNKKGIVAVSSVDGLDSNELKIIAGAILKKKQADEEVRVRSEAIEALKL